MEKVPASKEEKAKLKAEEARYNAFAEKYSSELFKLFPSDKDGNVSMDAIKKFRFSQFDTPYLKKFCVENGFKVSSETLNKAEAVYINNMAPVEYSAVENHNYAQLSKEISKYSKDSINEGKINQFADTLDYVNKGGKCTQEELASLCGNYKFASGKTLHVFNNNGSIGYSKQKTNDFAKIEENENTLKNLLLNEDGSLKNKGYFASTSEINEIAGFEEFVKEHNIELKHSTVDLISVEIEKRNNLVDEFKQIKESEKMEKTEVTEKTTGIIKNQEPVKAAKKKSKLKKFFIGIGVVVAIAGTVIGITAGVASSNKNKSPDTPTPDTPITENGETDKSATSDEITALLNGKENGIKELLINEVQEKYMSSANSNGFYVDSAKSSLLSLTSKGGSIDATLKIVNKLGTGSSYVETHMTHENDLVTGYLAKVNEGKGTSTDVASLKTELNNIFTNNSYKSFTFDSVDLLEQDANIKAINEVLVNNYAYNSLKESNSWTQQQCDDFTANKNESTYSYMATYPTDTSLGTNAVISFNVDISFGEEYYKISDKFSFKSLWEEYSKNDIFNVARDYYVDGVKPSKPGIDITTQFTLNSAAKDYINSSLWTTYTANASATTENQNEAGD